ncbi:MAG: choice-of-anchor D domain-containing protein [Bacteroidia bacterium]|nr:choice-of-anchor D domain-containing protein [Bacteroidia bacterium]
MIASVFPRITIVCLALALHAAPVWGQSTCDTDRSCTGNALLFPGGDFDYVDVFNSPALGRIDVSNALSVTLWANVSRQNGVQQFIGGVWGPRTDRDDKWLLYIDETDSLTFELSNGVTSFGRFDNTVIKAPMTYDSWLHIAVMWDGATQEALLYIDGRLSASGRNADYPIASLQSTVSYLQLGSFNGMTNDPTRTKPLTGQLDEIRIWDRVLSEAELRCGRSSSLTGNEPGLILYFRCNEIGGDILCDASRFNGRGNRRGALRFVPATRVVPQSVFVTPQSFSFPLGCISDTTLTVTLTDTSACAQQVSLSLTGRDASSFVLATNTLTLQQNQPVLVQLQTNIRITGVISANLTVRPLNSCNPVTVIPISITRNTELGAAPGRVIFDTLFGCIDKRTSDTTVRLCNNSGAPLTVNALGLTSPAFSALPSGWSLPLTLQPGDCRDVLLRFSPADTGSYFDTLRIVTTDPCPGSGLIPLSGRSVQIARTTIASIDFDQPGLPCRRSLNLAEEFFLRNMSGENFTVEAIEFSTPEFSSPTTMPFTARPNTAYRMYIRFRSSVEGVYVDTARIRILFRGCIVYRTIPVRGRIVALRLAARDTLVDFGNVVVGRTQTLPVTLDNNGNDARDIFMYLSSGRAFSFAGGNRFTLNAASSSTVNVTFRPLNVAFFRDTLNFQDVGCQVITRVLVQGNGVDGSLTFSPGYLQAGNVINCRCRQDTVTVTNNTAAPLTLRNVSIAGSIKFTFLPPLPSVNEILQPLQQRRFVIQYCPAGAPDFVTERADLVFDTDGPDGELRMLLTGTNIEPKLTIDPSTDFGDVEVGSTLTMVLRLTNPSPTPVTVDNIPPLPTGFSVVSAVPPLGSVLQYRDTMLVTVQFAPTNNITYSGPITATSTNPCSVTVSGALRGRGIIVPLFVPWSTIVFSEATRCDSVLRIIGLVNDGSVPIRIDSIWIAGPDSLAFTWRGRTFAGLPPRDTPPHSADSIDVYFHPRRSPSVQTQAQLHIMATTRLGQQLFIINLVGGRIEQFIPSLLGVLFPSTPVLNVATPVNVSFQNPSYLETLYIDSVSFIPDQGVFSFTGALPLAIAPRQSRNLSFGFRPRAAVDYNARVRLVTRVGCVEVDTTLSISGSGYTPPWLVTLCIDSTIVADIGDVLRLPVMLNRDIPQNPLDIDLFVSYHRRALQYLGFEPVFTTASARDTLRPDGVKISIPANQHVKAGPIGYISFRVAASDSMQFLLRTDSISFASDSVLFIALFGDGCFNSVTINPHCGISRLAFSANRYSLSACYPNPAVAQTSIEFETLEDTHVRIVLRDATGRNVAVLTDGFYQHGRYVLNVDTSALSAGVYSYIMSTANFYAARTLIIIR